MIAAIDDELVERMLIAPATITVRVPACSWFVPTWSGARAIETWMRAVLRAREVNGND